jgi:simple sugar transport system ATP-binding protein
VILARELADEPSVLIATSPTRGLDVGATEYVRSRLLESTQQRGSNIIDFSDIEEIIQLSDRIAVIYNGRANGYIAKGSQPEQDRIVNDGEKTGGKHRCQRENQLNYNSGNFSALLMVSGAL